MQSLWVPDRRGESVNVVLGFDRLEHYVSDFTEQPWPAEGGSGNTYFGAIVGRYANRIAGASFELGGERYELPANNGPNCMHGGINAWNTVVWEAAPSELDDAVALTLRMRDPDGANGFPGTVQASVRYVLGSDDQLRIEYRAESDKRTVINLTNHTYFNLAGSGHVYDQLVRIDADRFTPIDGDLVPTGELAAVDGTPFDFRTPKPIGRDIRRADLPRGDQLARAHGYDHNFVLNGSGLRLAAVAEDPASGRRVELRTDQPGVQLYTSNFVVGDLVGTEGRTYRQGDAFALETQHFPDSPHHLEDPEWPSVLLSPGEEFRSITSWRFASEAAR